MNQDLERFIPLILAGRLQEVEEWALPRAEQGEADAQFLLEEILKCEANQT